MVTDDGGGLLDQSEIEALFGAMESAAPTPAEPAAAPPREDPVFQPSPAPSAPSLEELNVQPFQFGELQPGQQSEGEQDLAIVLDVELDVRVELGRTKMFLEDVLKLREGSIVPLEKLAGDPVDIYVNGQLMARGEVLVLNDNFCVRISEILDHDTRIFRVE